MLSQMVVELISEQIIFQYKVNMLKPFGIRKSVKQTVKNLNQFVIFGVLSVIYGQW